MELEDLANSKLNPIIDFWLVAISKKSIWLQRNKYISTFRFLYRRLNHYNIFIRDTQTTRSTVHRHSEIWKVFSIQHA